jgi:hypothetical protein
MAHNPQSVKDHAMAKFVRAGLGGFRPSVLVFDADPWDSTISFTPRVRGQVSLFR